MKAIFLATMLFVSANVFCQTIEPTTLTPEQEKSVKIVQKEAKNKIEKVLDDVRIPAAERKNNVHTIRSDRDARLYQILNPSQYTNIMVKDPVNWNKALNKIDKQEVKKQQEAEKALQKKLDAEKKQRLSEVKTQQKELEKQMDDVDRQKENLKLQKKETKQQISEADQKESELKAQKKALKQKEKDIKKEYDK